MGDPLVWRRGDGPMAAWLERTADLLVGPQPDGYEVRGDIHWPDQPYGRITHQGLGLPDLAEVLTAARIDGLCALTEIGGTPGEARVRFEPLTWQDRGPNRTVPLAEAVPAGIPAGRVPLSTAIRSTAELAQWLGRLSPLLPEGIDAPRWPASALADPLAAVFLHRREEAMLSIDTLESRQWLPGDGTRQLLVRAGAERLAEHARLLGSSAVLQSRRPAHVRDIAVWLGELSGAWGGGAPPGPGRRARAARLPRGERAQVWELAHGAAILLIDRQTPGSLMVQGPPAEVARWAAPLLEPAVHEDVPSSAGRRLIHWLRRIEAAVFGGPAAWTVTVDPAPLTTPELAAWLGAHCPGRRITVSQIADGTVELGGTRTPRGWTTVTGRRGGAREHDG